ncbi:hypothetical protein [Natrarchaeobaculum sulfurireducens]|uniref:Uncharacterized protein n=1 Tax=Natrarchaeobaculum sulfurireducens TaxID=2044521 RepID=A0A346PPQ6_9EURY|nr:hypothetical protein [Natrarchaeobaculum sulfurireducens]AXR81501.1 hypothetical protein AArcMg_1488 [Natrarchaeobaculum sulfurireducens]
MRFQYNGNLSPGNVVSLRARVEFEIEADGTFEVDDPELADEVDAKTDHEPVEDDTEADGLDEMGYRDMQQLAAEHDDIPGNLPEDQLREALRERR